MFTNQKQFIIKLFDNVLTPLLIDTNLRPTILLERPRNPLHGDFACNIAMQLAKFLKKNPFELAQTILDGVLIQPNATQLIATANIAGPGFINLYTTNTAKQAIINTILIEQKKYGMQNIGHGKKVLIEFVSANPTGPLHVGHGRQGVLGDALVALLRIQNYDVTSEFYYNNTGTQIKTLAMSVQARAKGLKPGDLNWPQPAYNGDYINDIACAFLSKKTIFTNNNRKLISANGIINDLESIRHFAIAYLRQEQDIDLQNLGIKFDNYYLESSLYIEGKVANVVDTLIKTGKTYTKNDALWLRTTDYGDDKDRVMKKTDGSYTYFIPDIAYHITKWQRGFKKVINIQGHDHCSTITRIRAGLQAMNLGIPKNYPNYILHKMVTVIKQGKEIKISKRAGSYITLRDLIKWSDNYKNNIVVSKSEKTNFTRGRDVVRFFLVSRKADSEFVFDIDIALDHSDKNPVYYVQYAHARICSILTQWGGDEKILNQISDLSKLVAPQEISLLMKLAEYPDILKCAATDLEPHQITFYLRDLASTLHKYYNTQHILTNDNIIKIARLALIHATRQVLYNGLTLIGVSAPTKM